MKAKREVMNGVLREEFERLGKMEKFYDEEIKKLPKGSILKRTIGSKQYHYLKLRDENTGQVKSIYLRAAEVPQISKMIVERKRMTELLKQIKVDKRVLGKVLKEDE